jgi:hypothetical protein
MWAQRSNPGARCHERIVFRIQRFFRGPSPRRTRIYHSSRVALLLLLLTRCALSSPGRRKRRGRAREEANSPPSVVASRELAQCLSVLWRIWLENLAGNARVGEFGRMRPIPLDISGRKKLLAMVIQVRRLQTTKVVDVSFVILWRAWRYGFG